MRFRGVALIVLASSVLAACSRRAAIDHARLASPLDAGPRARGGSAALVRAPKGAEPGITRADGDSFAMVEWVDADVVRVKRLAAITVEANEIRCAHVRRVTGFPVPKDMQWRRAEGDVVEIDDLWAHHVSARLIIADEIEATVVKRVAKPYRWAGADAGAPVHNRIVYVDLETGKTSVEPPQRPDPTF